MDVCESVCCRWPVGLSSESLKQHQCLEGPLCLFWCKDHTKSCACMNLQDWTKDIDQSGVRFRGRETFRAQDVGPEQLKGSMESRMKKRSSEDDDQMSQHFRWLFKIFAEFL